MKTLCSPVLASFAYSRRLPLPLMSSQRTEKTAMGCFQDKKCTRPATTLVERLTYHHSSQIAAKLASSFTLSPRAFSACACARNSLRGVKDWVLLLQSYQQISCGCGQLNACAYHLHIIIPVSYTHLTLPTIYSV